MNGLMVLPDPNYYTRGCEQPIFLEENEPSHKYRGHYWHEDCLENYLDLVKLHSEQNDRSGS